MDLDIRGIPHVAEYVVGVGYGLSRRDTATFGWEGVERPASSFGELEALILSELAT